LRNYSRASTGCQPLILERPHVLSLPLTCECSAASGVKIRRTDSGAAWPLSWMRGSRPSGRRPRTSMTCGSEVFAPPIEVASKSTYSLSTQNGRPEHLRATIKNVAERAGVSVSTVSLVVIGRSRLPIRGDLVCRRRWSASQRPPAPGTNDICCGTFSSNRPGLVVLPVLNLWYIPPAE